MDKSHYAIKRVQISACIIRNSVPKVKGKHFIFKANVAGIKTRLLIDNSSKTKLIDQFFVRANKISTFKLKQKIKLELKNGEMVEWLDRTCLIELKIGNHQKQLLCYVANLDAYTVVLGDRWLEQHNPAID